MMWQFPVSLELISLVNFDVGHLAIVFQSVSTCMYFWFWLAKINWGGKIPKMPWRFILKCLVFFFTMQRLKVDRKEELTKGGFFFF